jgi:hypothetical protein
MEAKLMYLPLFGGGYTGLTPEQIGRMPLDKLFWHVRRLDEMQERDAAAFKGETGAPAPPPDRTPGVD